MKKNTVSAVRRFFNSVVNRRQVVETRVRAPKVRLLRLEGLEERKLLDASPIVNLANAGEIACVATLEHKEEFEAIDLSDAVTAMTRVVTSTADDESVGTLCYILSQAEDDGRYDYL